MPKSINKIFAAIIISLLFVGISALYLVYEDVKNESISKYGEILNIYTNKSADALESFIAEYKSDLEFCASLKDVIDFNSKGKTILDKFYSSRKNYIAAITRIDKDGKIEYTAPYNSEAIGVDVSNQDHNRKVKETKKVIVSDIFKAVQGFKTIAMAYPIMESNGNYKGTLTTLIPFRHISEKFISDINLDKSAIVNLMSSSGLIIFSDNLNQIGKEINTSKNSDLLEKIKQLQKQKRNNKGVFKTEDGDQVFAYSTIQLIDTYWIVALSVPTEIALENMQNFQSKYNLIIISFAISLLLSFIIFVRIRKRYAQENYERQLFFNLVAERTGQIVYDYNYTKGSIGWFGAITELTGFTKEEFSKFSLNDWKNLIKIEDQKLIKHFDEAEEINKTLNIQYRIKKASGEFIYVEDRNVIVEDTKNQTLRIIGTIKDINDQKNAEYTLLKNKEALEELVKQRTLELETLNAELARDIEERKVREFELQIAKDKAVAADKIKSDFLAQISHEIRTPISTMLNFTQLLFDEFKENENETFQIAYNSINSAGKRMIRTIDLILNVSEVQSNSYDYNMEKFNVYNDSIIPLVNEFKAAAKNKNLSLEVFNNTDNTPIVNKDLYSVTQIFANLIDNAIKYTKKGSVKIFIENNENLIVKVTDTGIGISEKYLPSLFEPFTQEETGYTRKFDGTGLGMALVNKYCELNNLKIAVESVKNEGTTFTVSFA